MTRIEDAASQVRIVLLAGSLAAAVAVGGCASPGRSSSPAPAPAPTAAATSSTAAPGKPTKVVTGPDGKEIGEYVGPMPAANSKFAKLKFGMSQQQVMNILGAPTDSSSHETGKRWIPFYFGSDVRRMELLYAGEGCLSFNLGNAFGGGGDELIAIEADPKGTCFSK